jgi:hypothetical protein
LDLEVILILKFVPVSWLLGTVHVYRPSLEVDEVMVRYRKEPRYNSILTFEPVNPLQRMLCARPRLHCSPPFGLVTCGVTQIPDAEDAASTMPPQTRR